MRKATSALVGLLLAGVAATPAHAETIRERQWHLNAMKADDIWKISTGKGVTIAVIDTGVGRLAELDGQVVQGKDFSHGYEGDERTDYKGHGTGISAMIAGTGKHPSGDGSFGLAPDAKILPLRVSEGGGGLRHMQSISEAIRFAADSDAKIMNISFGGLGQSDELDVAVRYALGKGKLIFAAVGNDGAGVNQIIYPSGSPGVVGVSAVGPDGGATDESQHGPQVDMSAPGIDILTSCPGDGSLCKTHGTSSATALASASAALLWSAHPDWTNNQVLRVLLNTAGKPEDGAERNDWIGYGVVRPKIALPTPGDPGPADVFPLPDLAAAEAATKSPSASADGKAPDSAASPKPAAQAEEKKEGSLLPWIGLGLGACLLIGGAVTAVVVRRNR
ncbi:type VII secretion-associated serine protease mycosin [Streptomyces sp. APSN-46.1]|uniref:type VII secretion-associated serine protease mycosin n=1 Tax=Streptomyces sp. APSN-46.1 TaxID=2929049 RepID=UPI001FB522B3|nr:type VII secretion-associated serine protease mycosin [Streptomyces sp. APSN-46.1]MCJ1677080.1 type VII secretion-associated serine protease mycosin [Streptomyces sp. APSN-46.1]